MNHQEVIIIGAGPCGLAAAIALKDKGIQPLIIEKKNVANTLFQFPTHQTFFSSSEKLEIGGIAFVTEHRKPTRNQALSYYREVVKRKQLTIHTFEKATTLRKEKNGCFQLQTVKNDGETVNYRTPFIVIATGYYDHPNRIGVKGEELAKVTHYFKEAHPYFDKDVVVIGGKNSAVDASLELHKAGARVTVLYRGNDYSSSIKPWILPEFSSLINKGEVQMYFNANVIEITQDEVFFQVDMKGQKIKNDFVFAMTGYKPDHSFLKQIGIEIDEQSGRPLLHPETMETNQAGVFIAGVIAAGNNANEIFIENGRFHGELLANAISKRI
jgi:thioredoxin reductase (NADPH)